MKNFFRFLAVAFIGAVGLVIAGRVSAPESAAGSILPAAPQLDPGLTLIGLLVLALMALGFFVVIVTALVRPRQDYSSSDPLPPNVNVTNHYHNYDQRSITVTNNPQIGVSSRSSSNPQLTSGAKTPEVIEGVSRPVNRRTR